MCIQSIHSRFSRILPYNNPGRPAVFYLFFGYDNRIVIVVNDKIILLSPNEPIGYFYDKRERVLRINCVYVNRYILPGVKLKYRNQGSKNIPLSRKTLN